MGLATIAVFLIMAWGFGYSLLYWTKQEKNIPEKIIMQIGVGIGTISVAGFLLNKFLFIPLNVWLFLLLSLAIPFYGLFIKKDYLNYKPKKITGLKKSHIYLILTLAMTFMLLFVMVKGSFALKWFEDGDPWEHASVAYYISNQQTISKPVDMYIAHYMEPYPQGYTIIMGLMSQVEQDIYWTLKFINALMVSLSVLFAYFFGKLLTGKRKIGLLFSFFLFATPTFQSHFIFAQTMALMMFLPALYAITKSIDDKKWIAAAAVTTGSILITQQVSGFVFGVFFGFYYLIRIIVKRNIQLNMLIAGSLSLLIALSFYGSMYLKYDPEVVAKQYTVGEDPNHKSFFNFADSGSIRYLKPTDFINPCISDDQSLIKKCGPWYGNKTDNPTGFGVFLSLIIIVGLIYSLYIIFFSKEELTSTNLTIILSWGVFTFLMVIGDYLPYKILPNRAWAFFSIPVALFAAYGYGFIEKLLHKKASVPKIITALIIVGLVMLTSFYPKYVVNTSGWAPHHIAPTPEFERSYYMLKSLPKDTSIFTFCHSDSVIIAYNKQSPIWDPETYEYRYNVDKSKYGWDSASFWYQNNITEESKMFSLSPEVFAGWLKTKEYDYVLIDPYHCYQRFGQNETFERAKELAESGYFGYIQEFQPNILLKVI